MEFSILGSLVVRADGSELALTGAKPRALLLRLLLARNRAVPSERLIDDLWEDDPPRSAAQTLQSYISQLRKVLGSDRVVTDAGGYRLVVHAGELDVESFESAIAEGRGALSAGGPETAGAILEQVLAHWRGTPLSDAGGAAWALPEVSRLEELHLTALESLLGARLARGDDVGVIAGAEAAVAEHPLRERLWAQLITALYRQGRQAEALRAYQRLRHHLADELGIDPSPELQALEQRVLAQDSTLAGPAAAVRTSHALPTGVVTFLLTDIVGSTALWDTHPTEMGQALSRHDAIIRAAVSASGGIVLKARGEGDSTFSVFGRATDAVAAARAIQRGLVNEAWPVGANLLVRMALHTGEALERDGDYYGPVVNRVARLRSLAEGGQILVSRSTAELVVDHLPVDCHLVELGASELRDLARPETVYLLVTPATPHPDEATSNVEGAARVPLPASLAGSPFSGFHGRASERELLLERLKVVGQGSHRVVLIAGEPGIGKTALSAEVSRVAFAGGATVLYGRCDEDLGVPYRPWVEALSHLVAHADGSVLERMGRRRLSDLARLVPEIGARVPGLNTPVGVDAEAERYMLFGAVVAILEWASVDSPLVLILDDLHWADKPTLSLLRHVVSVAEPLSVLVIGTYRHSELSSEHPLADVLAALRREPSVERLNLGGLADDELVAAVEAASGQQLAGTELGLVHAVNRETDGNPFFAWEIILHLSESGAVALSEGGQWLVRGQLDEMSLPDSVREVIGRRVARLAAGVKPVLSTAAVIGRDFDLDVLAGALATDAEDVLDALERAEAAQLVTSVAQGRFTFNHALIPHTLYQDLNPTRRAQLHRRVAEAIEHLDRSGTRVTELARHWAEATVPAEADRAIEYARRAGEIALRSLAPDEAVRWYNQALRLLTQRGSPDETLRCELLLGRGEAQRQVGDPAYRQTLLDVAAVAQQLGDTDRLVRAALLNTRRGTGGIIDPDRLNVQQVALAAVGPDDSTQRARLLGLLAVESQWSGDFSRRRALADEGLAIARRLDDVATLAQVLNDWCVACWTPETLQTRAALIDEAIRLASEVGDPVASFWAIQVGIAISLEAADPGAAHQLRERQAALVDEVRDPNIRYLAMPEQITRCLYAGDFEDAERWIAETYEMGQSSGQPDALTLYGAELVWLRWHQGREAELLDLLVQAAASTPDMPAYQSAVALSLVEVGRGDEVVVDPAVLHRLPYDAAWAVGLTVWAEVVSQLRAVDLAKIIFDRLARFPDYVAHTSSFGTGPIAHYLGVLATVLRRYDEAETFFRQADEIHERLRAPFYWARTDLAWGQMLLERGERERAVELLERALARARQYGCAGVERRALVALGSANPS